MKRILMLSTHGYFEAKPSLGLPDTGGQVVFVIELSKALAKYGYKIDILSRKFNRLAEIEKINKDVRIIRIPCGGKKFIPKEYLIEKLPELIKEFTEYCRKNNLNYKFINSHYWDAGFVGMKLAREFKTPHIFTPHSLGWWKKKRMEKTLKKSSQSELEKKYNFSQRIKTEKEIMKRAAKTTATTPLQKDIINQEYGISKNKILITTPGFDKNKYRIIKKNHWLQFIKENNLPENFVLTVGRTARNKGYDLLIKAMKQVFNKKTDINLIMAIGSRKPTINETRQIKELTALAKKLKISQKIFILGYLEKLEYLYNGAKLFVMPSTYEPFGMTAIEAMACQTATIITDKGGLKDFIIDDKESLIVNPENIKELSEKILLLLEDKKLNQKISKAGYKKVKMLFPWEKIAKNNLKIIKKL